VNDIHLNPNLTTFDKWAGAMFFGFILLMFTFVALNAMNGYLRERRGFKCFWCKKHWIGRGCGCIPRWGTVGARDMSPGSDAWQALSYEGKLFRSARFAHLKYLEARRKGRRGDSWCWQARREAYLRSLRLYRDSQKAAA